MSMTRRRCAVALWVCLLALGGVDRAAAGRLCLPPAVEAGRRLHHPTDLAGTWLPLQLRQHELCWRDEPGEVRVGLFGNSAVYGFPLAAEQSLAEQVNQRFAQSGTPAHMFNLGYVFTYMPRDMIVIEAALPYGLDVIVYAFTLADMTHIAPPFYPPMLISFFNTNVGTLERLVATPPVGLEEPFGKMQPVVARNPSWKRWVDQLRQIGLGVRLLATYHAEQLGRRLAVIPPVQPPTTGARRREYDCGKTTEENQFLFRDWSTWNVLASLDALRGREGVAVLVVNWPLAHEPVDGCYNFRYTTALAEEFNAWMRSETDRLGLPYLDLHDLLPPERFFDSLHLDADGQEQVAARIVDALRPLIEARE